MREKAILDAMPEPEGKLLTLSTCTGQGSHAARWMVQARLGEVYPMQ